MSDTVLSAIITGIATLIASPVIWSSITYIVNGLALQKKLLNELNIEGTWRGSFSQENKGRKINRDLLIKITKGTLTLNINAQFKARNEIPVSINLSTQNFDGRLLTLSYKPNNGSPYARGNIIVEFIDAGNKLYGAFVAIGALDGKIVFGKIVATRDDAMISNKSTLIQSDA